MKREEILERIEGIRLSARLESWRAAVKAAPWRLFAEREKYTVESWRATEGEDIQVRRAKLVKHVLENIPIAILEYDKLAGRNTTAVIGANTSIDVCGDYMPDLWKESGEVNLTLNADAVLDEESIGILREAVRVFKGRTAPENTNRAWRDVMGDWPEDASEGRIKDPTLDVGIFGNVTSVLMWKKLLGVGLRGIMEEAQAHIDEFYRTGSTEIDKLYFWQSSIIVCEGIIAYAHRYGDLAGRMSEREHEPERKRELEAIKAACERVPEHPAGSFREALQSMSILAVSKLLEHPMHNNPHWGRGDQYLYPYFKGDIESGAISVEEAGDLLAELIGRWGTQIFVTNESQRDSHQVNFAINNVLLGGMDTEGKDASNELSYLFLHMAAQLKLSSPTVGIRWNRKTPEWLMRKAIETNMETKGGIPLFLNDENMTGHYVADGIPYKEAVEWCGLGCVYPCLPTRAEHYGAEGVAGFNVAAVLHLALHNGKAVTGKQVGLKTGDAREYKSFEELYTAFKKQYRYVIERVFRLAAVAREVQHKYLRLPLCSTLSLQAAMDLGQDTLIPHPEYSMYGISDRAIIDVADSLIAVRKLVFEEGRLTMGELMEALDSNFECERGEYIRQLCLGAPKFGNNIDEVDYMAKELSEYSAGEIKGYDNSPYRGYMIAREGLAWHYYGGLGVGALPNGRRAKEPLNDGSVSPMRGADSGGPTTVTASVLKAGFEDSYAHVLNQKFSAAIFNDRESVGKLIDFTTAFMENGGTHIQYNIVDSEELKTAKRKPEEYRDLITRVGGFSAYFTQLSEEIQDDVINRSEQRL